MTREEAIRLIGWMKCATNREDDLEAIDMAIEALSAETVSRFHHDMEIKELKHQIKDQADMVSVVRCKDCRHSDTTGVYVEDVVYCKWLHTSCVKNGYCHRGERKGGDTE